MTKCRRCTCPNVADQFAIDDPAGDAAGTPYPGQMDAVRPAGPVWTGGASPHGRIRRTNSASAHAAW
jgi:hypothetical protein